VTASLSAPIWGNAWAIIILVFQRSSAHLKQMYGWLAKHLHIAH
jgi:hypothetical protein